MSTGPGVRKCTFVTYSDPLPFGQEITRRERDHPPANLCRLCHFEPIVPKPEPDSIDCHMIR